MGADAVSELEGAQVDNETRVGGSVAGNCRMCCCGVGGAFGACGVCSIGYVLFVTLQGRNASDLALEVGNCLREDGKRIVDLLKIFSVRWE